MRSVVQRVEKAAVIVSGKRIAEIKQGILVLLGIGRGDQDEDVRYLVEKITHLRIFEDENGKMNLAPEKVGAELLIVSQFTLYADCTSRRPGFTAAAGGVQAEPLYEHCVEQCRQRGFHVECGIFGADMAVSSVNDGPVTLILDTQQL